MSYEEDPELSLAKPSASWTAFKMTGSDMPADLTISTIFKSMKIFEKDHKVNVVGMHHPEILGWSLELEEKGHRMRTISRDPDRSSPDVPPVIKKYACALSVPEELFFVDKCLNKKLQGLMAKALKCTGFQLLQMDSGTPSQLRLLYIQSENVNPGGLEFQYQCRNFRMLDQLRNGYPLSNEVDTGPDRAKKARITLGSNRAEIPQITNARVSVRDAPIQTEIPCLVTQRTTMDTMTREGNG
ncbi:uncharacterized protein [Palaemon carinicauda]|uniref:uncharacterized protein isoform X2 n=1 Tax=Palaemon carinicauda TaxID=392227 RepID=UPI0035B5F978